MKQQNNESLSVTSDQLSKDQNLKKFLASPEGKKTPVTIVPKTSSTSVTSSTVSSSPTTSTIGMAESEVLIEPQDKATIKYLSNIKDVKTNKVSQPFIIRDKKYQMVRGIRPSKEIVMGVFCYDDINESGENVIHEIEYFEENMVKPVMEEEAMMGNDMELESKVNVEPEMETKKVDIEKGHDSLNLSEFKHYLVNEKTGKFRKFKTIVELAAAVMAENEKYMPIKEFRKFFKYLVKGGGLLN